MRGKVDECSGWRFPGQHFFSKFHHLSVKQYSTLIDCKHASIYHPLGQTELLASEDENPQNFLSDLDQARLA